MASYSSYHKLDIEIAESKVVAMLSSYNIPQTEENVDDLIARIQEDIDSDLDLLLENAASALADDLGITVD